MNTWIDLFFQIFAVAVPLAAAAALWWYFKKVGQLRSAEKIAPRADQILINPTPSFTAGSLSNEYHITRMTVNGQTVVLNTAPERALTRRQLMSSSADWTVGLTVARTRLCELKHSPSNKNNT